MKKINVIIPCPCCGHKEVYAMKMPRKENPYEIFCGICRFYIFDNTEQKAIDRWNSIDAEQLEKDYQKWLKKVEASEPERL